MAPTRAEAILPIPRWLALAISVLIIAHLLALGGRVLSARSGPWPTEFGPSPEMPPQFAQDINDVSSPYYLTLVRMTHDYHFTSNRPEQPGVYFEVELKDDKGAVKETLRFPDDKANFWVKHRQALLARGLADDIPVQAPQGEAVGAPGRAPPSIEIWDAGAGKIAKLRMEKEHLIPRNGPPMFRPSEWSRILARSYARYLCRTRNAASAEVIRHTKEPLFPSVLLIRDSQMNPEEFVAAFGDLKLSTEANR